MLVLRRQRRLRLRLRRRQQAVKLKNPKRDRCRRLEPPQGNQLAGDLTEHQQLLLPARHGCAGVGHGRLGGIREHAASFRNALYPAPHERLN